MQCAYADIIVSSVTCLWLYRIFPYYLYKRDGFRGKMMEHKICVLIFSTIFFWNTSLCKKIWARHDQKCILVFLWSTDYTCQILVKTEFSRETWKKISKKNFMKNHSRLGTSCLTRTDGQTVANSIFTQFLLRHLQITAWHQICNYTSPKAKGNF